MNGQNSCSWTTKSLEMHNLFPQVDGWSSGTDDSFFRYHFDDRLAAVAPAGTSLNHFDYFPFSSVIPHPTSASKTFNTRSFRTEIVVLTPPPPQSYTEPSMGLLIGHLNQYINVKSGSFISKFIYYYHDTTTSPPSTGEI